MPGRKYSAATQYRYGFNGQEKSIEIIEGNNYTAEYWEYDSRIGRRWNTDPIIKDDESSYMVLGNNPIVMVDPNGADWYKNKKTGAYDWLEGSGRQQGYKHMKTGTWSARNANNISYFFGNSKDGLIMDSGNPLPEVVVTAKSKDKASGKNLLNWPSYTKEDVNRWNGYHAMFRDRNSFDQPLVQENDPQEYKDNFAYYQRSWQANQDWRAMNYAILDGATFFVPVPKVGMLRWLKYGGRTFQEAKVAIWARNAKPVFQVIRNESSGQTFKVFAEIHHKYIPQRWGLPNWITNSRFNLQITNSIEHGLMDPYRYQFFPRWIKEGVEAGTITGENLIRIK